MKKRKVVYGVFMCLFFLLVQPLSQHSESYGDGIDIILLIDSSGSMKKSDPKNLRHQAAKAFVDLVSLGDQIAVLDFSSECKTFARLSVVNSNKDREVLKSCIDKVGSSGKMTDMLIGLEKALEVINSGSREGHSKSVILLTDGKLEIPATSRFYNQQEKGIQEICHKYKNSSIKILSIAYTEEADVKLLSRFAKNTNGGFYVAEKDNELFNVYFQIFVDLKKRYGGFVIDSDINTEISITTEMLTDKYVKDIVFAFNRSNKDIKIGIQNPDGEFIDTDITENVSITEAEKYMVFRIKNPPQGKWNVAIHGQGHVYGRGAATTDLLLKLNSSKDYFSVNEPIILNASLMLNENIELIDGLKLNLKIARPDGRIVDIELFDNGEDGDKIAGDGVFSFSYVGEALSGEYKVYAIAEKNEISFKRESQHMINRGSIFELFSREINCGEVIKGERAEFQLKARSSFSYDQSFKPIILTFYPVIRINVPTIDSPPIEPEKLVFPPGKDSRAQIYMSTAELPYGVYKGKFQLESELNQNEDTKTIHSVRIDFKLSIIAPVFEFITNKLDFGDIIIGVKAKGYLKARSTYCNARMFDFTILNEQKSVSFLPGEVSEAEFEINTDDLPFGIHEGQFDIKPRAGAEEKIGIKPLEPMNLSFKLNILPPPSPPNPIFVILISFVFLIIILFIILYFYEKGLPNFSGTLVYESLDGSIQQYSLIGIKKSFFKRLSEKGREIKIGGGPSVDIKISREVTANVQAVLRSERSLRGRQANDVIFPVPGHEIKINDQALLGVSKTLKHDDVIIIGNQKLRYENFSQDQEEILDL